MAANKKKMSTAMIVMITILALTISTFLVVVCAFFAGLSGEGQKQSYVGSKALSELATETVSVKINMENCTMTVGTKVKVTATIYPSGSEEGIIWTSSDENVFTVDSKGNLNVIGEGIVALTASFGNASDSIAIECVRSEAEAVLNLPDYSAFTSNSANKGSTSGNNERPSQSESITERENSSAVTQASTEKVTQPSVEKVTQPSTERVTQQTTTADTVSQTTAAQTTPSYTLETTTQYEGDKVTSAQIAEKLTGYGFSQYLSNTYVYEENDTYKGEVIISSNMTHIYIKERGTGFDSAIKDILTEMLPDSHDSIWSMYNETSSDKTLNVDGRVVRVVVSGNDGHSQIVIYN